MNFDQDRVCLIGCFYLILAEQVESFLFDQAIDTGWCREGCSIRIKSFPRLYFQVVVDGRKRYSFVRNYHKRR